MKLVVAAVGQRLPDWASAAVADYLARFPADFAVQVAEVKAATRDNGTPERWMAAEAQRLRAAVPAGSVLVALDERGRDWTTREFAQQLAAWRDASETVAFAIGGADGLDPAFKREARVTLRLSAMTLPHALARVLLVEQLYRAWSLLARHPYHRD